jgi:hypothetical protein
MHSAFFRWLFILWMPCAAQAADDAPLLRELRAGAVVLLRHAQTTPGVGDPPGWKLERCESQRNLAPVGIEHARRIGQWFRAHNLRVVAVRNSPWCRTRDTAQLAFSRHDDWPALSNIFEDRSGADAQAAAVKQYIEASSRASWWCWCRTARRSATPSPAVPASHRASRWWCGAHRRPVHRRWCSAA